MAQKVADRRRRRRLWPLSPVPFVLHCSERWRAATTLALILLNLSVCRPQAAGNIAYDLMTGNPTTTTAPAVVQPAAADTTTTTVLKGGTTMATLVSGSSAGYCTCTCSTSPASTAAATTTTTKAAPANTTTAAPATTAATTLAPATTTTIPVAPATTTTTTMAPATTTTTLAAPATTTLPVAPATTTTLAAPATTTLPVAPATTTTPIAAPPTTTTMANTSGGGQCGDTTQFRMVSNHALASAVPVGRFGGYFLMQWSCEELCVRNYYMELCVGYMYEVDTFGKCTLFQNSIPGIQEVAGSTAVVCAKNL